ncbi:MAG: hypothetical protein QOE33_423 [Acidobacteriota bacterium]|nr:hypothetical protein [Acidobacteriota bacterium]
MSEDRTQNLPNDEFRQILAQLTSINSRLDRVDSRLDSMDARLERLEARDYDTKPIWENAFKEIADLRAEMREGFEKVNVKFDQVNAKFDQIDAKFDQVNARIENVQVGVNEGRAEMTVSLRKMSKQIEILNNNILEMGAEVRLLDDRISRLEPQPAP